MGSLSGGSGGVGPRPTAGCCIPSRWWPSNDVMTPLATAGGGVRDISRRRTQAAERFGLRDAPNPFDQSLGAHVERVASKRTNVRRNAPTRVLNPPSRLGVASEHGRARDVEGMVSRWATPRAPETATARPPESRQQYNGCGHEARPCGSLGMDRCRCRRGRLAGYDPNEGRQYWIA